MLATHRLILSILPVNKKYFVFFLIALKLKIILNRARLIYCFKVNDWGVKTIDKARCIWKKIGEASSKSKMTFTYSHIVLVKVYSAMIRKVYNLLYDFKLGTKLAKAFYYRQSQIYKDNIGEAKYLPFC